MPRIYQLVKGPQWRNAMALDIHPTLLGNFFFFFFGNFLFSPWKHVMEFHLNCFSKTTEPHLRKMSSGHIWTVKAQISLHIRAVWLGPSLTTYRFIVYSTTESNYVQQNLWSNMVLLADQDFYCLQIPWRSLFTLVWFNSNKISLTFSWRRKKKKYYPVESLTLVLLNKLRCHALFKFSANQITWSRLLIWIHILNCKQCRSNSVGFLEANWSGSTLFAKAGYIWVQQDKG